MRVFIDTNLWAYRLDQREPAKSDRVRGWLAELIADREIVFSMEMLIELRSVASRKRKPPLTDQPISALLKARSGFEVVGSEAEPILDVHQSAAVRPGGTQTAAARSADTQPAASRAPSLVARSSQPQRGLP
ncbi:MAG: PIN domain-containing protein [Cyanobium sp.]